MSTFQRNFETLKLKQLRIDYFFAPTIAATFTEIPYRLIFAALPCGPFFAPYRPFFLLYELQNNKVSPTRAVR